jgi:hypothetical protein
MKMIDKPSPIGIDKETEAENASHTPIQVSIMTTYRIFPPRHMLMKMIQKQNQL